MMHSESKEIYGANVFGLVALFCHVFPHRQTTRKLQREWVEERKTCAELKQSGSGYVDFEYRYKNIRQLAKSHQQRGAI